MTGNLISRWIFSPLESVPSPKIAEAETSSADPTIVAANVATAQAAYPPTDLPVCRQYADTWNAPWQENGSAMVSCMVDPTHLAAAQVDTRLVVLGSITDPTPIPDVVTTWYNNLKTVQSPGVPQAQPLAAGSSLADLLMALEHLHVNFMPEQ